jgi:hypothetical protein
MKNMKTKLKNKRLISTFEIIVMLTAIFAFAYILSSPEIVSASETTSATDIPKGCCPEANNGAICQDMNTFDANMCKTSLVFTSCDFYDPCKKGCCYNPSEGLCSPNSPKDRCSQNSGNWSSDATCDSQSQCALGCCVLGTQAPMVTSRQCTKLSNEYGFTKKWEAIDAEKGCTIYTDLEDEGACVIEEGEYAPFDCSFTTKRSCQSSSGKFYKNKLCTNIDLNTLCVPTTGGEFKTSCVEDKDKIYFIDSCGNKANIYDSSRANDPEYWKTVIPGSQSCISTPNSASCGNCDILAGSTCEQYRVGRDAKPDIGENICRDLNCNAYGKKHGESWCVGEYDTSFFGVAPVGSRWFKAICMDGEVTVEQCADFNQEICLQQSSGSFSEAQCVMNDWRTCLSANEVGDDDRTYEDVKEECDKYPQCVMFNEIPGETTTSDTYTEENTVGFPGFRYSGSLANNKQANYNGMGDAYNKVIPHCVPKYTEGLQFWTRENNSSSSSSSGASSNTNYGGNTAETGAICSMGNFICIGGEKKTKSGVVGGSFEEDENIICITDPTTSGVKDQVPVYIDTLNERCRMLGSCGVYVNVIGELGGNAEDIKKNSSKIIQRMKLDAAGETSKEKGSTDYYSEEYLASLSSKPGGYLALTEFEGTNANGAVPSVDALKIKDVISALQGDAKYDPGLWRQYGPSLLATVTQGLGFVLTQQFWASSYLPGGTGAGTSTWGGSSAIKTELAQTAVQENAGFAVEKAATAAAEADAALAAADSAAAEGTLGMDEINELYEIAESTQASADVAKASADEAAKTASTAKPPELSGLTRAGISIAVTIIVGIILNAWDPFGSGMTPGDKSIVYGTMASTMGFATAIALGLCAAPPGLGCVLGVVAFIAGIIISIVSYKTENQYYVMQYTCAPWEPPLDGQCNACNNNPVIPCSDYRCRSLGANCQYFNSLGEPGTCAKITDTTSATIKPWPEILTSPYAYSDVQEMKFTISDVEAYTGIQFGVITDKSAKCKIDTKHTQTYDEMAYDMISSASANGLVGYNHMIGLSPFVTSASSTTEETDDDTTGTGQVINGQVTGDENQETSGTDTNSETEATSENSEATLPLETGDNTYFIRCKNFAGTWNRPEFVVRVIVKEGPDATAPIITRFIPATNSYVGYGFNTTAVQFYVNEPSECRYSKEYDLAYNDMIGTTTCINTAVLGEWPCSTVLDLTPEDNIYYFKCKDTAGNKNENAYVYNLKSCQSGLNITSKSPSGKIKIGTATGNITLSLKTSGCIEGGKATCSYNLGNGNIAFANTDSTDHLQVFTTLPAGNYNIPVNCNDIAGNTANDVISFNLTTADAAPVVIFASKFGGTLKIITNEPAECRYAGNNTNSCAFNFEEGTKMTDLSTVHTTQYEKEKTYYIKCRNIFSITNSDCGIVVRPGE